MCISVLPRFHLRFLNAVLKVSKSVFQLSFNSIRKQLKYRVSKALNDKITKSSSPNKHTIFSNLFYSSALVTRYLDITFTVMELMSWVLNYIFFGTPLWSVFNFLDSLLPKNIWNPNLKLPGLIQFIWKYLVTSAEV